MHRIGRTGRAGASGIAVSFCSGEERDYLRDIERLIRRRIEQVRTPVGLKTLPKGRPTEDASRESRAPRPPRSARPSGGGGRRRRSGRGNARSAGR